MAVPRPDAGDKLIERILAVPWAQHNAAIAGEKARQVVPFGERAFVTIARGIRTARLFPHLTTCVSFGIWIYIEYTGRRYGEECGLYL
jgi:hypothetical protein